MSFFAGLDERERARREQDKALKEYLKLQNEETKRSGPGDKRLEYRGGNTAQCHWLESELNAGKTMLATLAARVDKLQDSTTADAATIRELSRQVAESDQRAREAAAQLASRMERDSSKLHQLVADIAGRQQSEERTIRDQDDRFRAAAEAINQMRYTTEASLLKANQVGNEFYAKAKDWEAEMRRGAESMRAIKDHEQALESLHTTVSATTETLARRTESALGEIRQRIDADARFRGQFEDSIRGVCAEIRRVIQSQERDLIDRVESLRQAAAAGVERVRQENAAALADRLEQQHQHEREVRDSQALLLEKVSQQLLAVDAILGDERQARRTLEAQLQTTLEEGFKLMQTAIAKRFGEVVENHQELKASVAQVTRSLQDSVFLVEKTLEGKIASVEEVLRAEIKSRMETDSAVSGLAEELTLKLDHSERKLAARIDEGIAESAREHDALVNETRETVAQVSKSIASAAADADTQLSALAGRIGESTRAVRDEIKALAANAAGIESDLRAAIDQAQAKMASESDRLESLVAENGAKMKGVDAACRELRVHVDERINLRGAQLDAALEAFKTELASRATKAEFADLSHLATTEDQRARTLIESLQKQVSELGASLDRHVSRTDLEDARAEIRLEVASAQEKAAHVEERLLQMSSDMATRISADTLVETESRLRESMRAIHERVSENDQQLQTMRSGLEERATNDMVSEVKTELAHRVLEQQQRIQHFATEIQGLREAFAAMPARADLEHVSASVTEQISSLVHSLNKLDSAQKAALASATERLDAQLASIGKREEDNHAKTQEAMSNINGQIESLEASAALLRQELAARIDTNTAAIEDKAHQLKEAIDAARQMADERLVEFSRRTDGISLSLSELSQHVTDAKQAAQLAAAESERREESAIQELRSVVAGLAQQKLVDELHSELDAVVDKLSSRIDIAMLTFEQQRQRMSDHEQANKDRWREMASANERSIRDSQQAIKSAREALSSRLASMEALVHEATKRAESSGADVKKLKADIQGPLAHTMHALERDVSLVKEDMRRCVVEREVMAIVATATRSVEARIDRVQDNISDLRREIEPVLQALPTTFTGAGGEF
nr:hypothetical protein HK105_002449 [Polyrhizophydium stewartii]